MVASFPELDQSKTSLKKGAFSVAAAFSPRKMKCSKTINLHPGGNNLGKIMSSRGRILCGSAADVCAGNKSGKFSSIRSNCSAQNVHMGIHSSKLGSKFVAQNAYMGDNAIYHLGDSGDGGGDSIQISSNSGKLRAQTGDGACKNASKVDLSSQSGYGGCNSIQIRSNSGKLVHAQSGDGAGGNPSKVCSYSCINLGYEDENGIQKKNSYVGENPSKVGVCSGIVGAHNVGAQINIASGGENPRKVSSSYGGNMIGAYGIDNSGNCATVCTSDNSGNHVRWSSSCASDTTSGSSTRRSSWESRSCPSAAALTCPIKPHKAHDAAWAAIRSLQLRDGGAPLGIGHFKLLRRVGHGDIGSVFLTQLRDDHSTNAACFFAIKVMGKEALTQRNKVQRMHTEREILECLDHPFLPTLYAHFDTEQFSCLVMEFCPGGDLYALRQKQLSKRFNLKAARFYAAEVLLALEYLHMLGIVYRDLKPENVLVREDGHIMLTDFDLSLKSEVKPELLKYPLSSASSSSISSSSSAKRRLLHFFGQSPTVTSSSTTSFVHHSSANCTLSAGCSIHPIIPCLSLSSNSSRKAQQTQSQQEMQQQGCELSMKSSRRSKASHPSKPQTPSNKDASNSGHLKVSKHDMEHSSSNTSSNDGCAQRAANMSTKTSKHNTTHTATNNGDGAERTSTSSSACQEDGMMFMELVAEPTQARSMSFVGTHEYLAPEIITGNGHGSPVDWWTFGIFLFELLFGKTPFKGASNDQTLINIIRQHLRFPEWAEYDAGEDAKSLIQGLLVKDPRKRLGSTKGAAEIKQHAFFKGVNWALIRSAQPPEVPNPNKKVMHLSSNQHNNHHDHHGNHHHDITARVLTINRPVSKTLPHFDYF